MRRNSFAVGLGADFGLDDDLVAGQRREDAAQLHLRRAVAARGLDVVDAQFEGAVDGGFEVRLVLGRDLIRA